jgi:hypothetical protein
MAITFERELAMSADEFLRILPAAARDARDAVLPGVKAAGPSAPPVAAEGAPYTMSERTIVIGKGERRVEIRLCEKGHRQLGALRLPVIRLRFEIFGLTPDETDRFMERFNFHYQRMGG